MKAVVLHGEVSEQAGKDEEDVLVQVDVVRRSLTEQGHIPVIVPVSMDLKKAVDVLANIKPDFVFNLVETIAGHGQLIHIAPSVMDVLGIPYTGAKTEAIFLTSNKVLAKKILAAGGLPTPQLFLADEKDNPFFQGPYIIKAIWEHASVWLDENSIVTATDENHLHQVLLSRQEHLGMDCFAESYIDGREFNLSLLAGSMGPEVLPPAEILFHDYPPNMAKVVDYRSKWVEDSFEYLHTPRSFEFSNEDEPLIQRLKDMAIQCWNLFGLRGYARVDFRVDENNQPWILEVNTNPCLSPDGGFVAALEQAGFTFNHAIERIIQDSLH